MTRRATLFGLACSIAGCGPYFAGHPLPEAPPSAERELSCLDLSVVVVRDPRLDPTGVIAGLRLSNRCDHPIPVDVPSIVVTATRTSGEKVQARFFDPRHQIRRYEMMTHASGTERLLALGVGAPSEVAEVCFDVSAIEGRAERTAPICWSSAGEAR
jgi:hypothetical protein